MNRIESPLLIRTALVVLGLLGLAACHKEVHRKAETSQFEATTPMRCDTEIAREYVCQIRACQHIALQTLERGYLQDVFVDEGQRVEKGQRMFQVMPLLYQAEMEKANAEAEFARIEFENTKMLQGGKVVSDQEVALAKAKLNKAKAEADLARAHLSLTEIKAPFSGIMDRLHVRKGSLLEEGALLTSLSDNSKMWVYFNVTEAEYLDYQARRDRGDPMRVKLRMANGKMFEHEGVVDTIEGEFHNTTGTIAFRATFPNPGGLLRHGQTGEVLTYSKYPSAMLIPQKATFEVLDRKYVFVVDKEHKIRAREIAVAAEKPHVYVVRSGLVDGETFLVDGLRRVRDGDEARVIVKEPAELFAKLDVPAK
ncbi:MAG: efflux RND transporter periplasmic adaptor subunit [Planctomycetes bacterium]|nr:efflux RND transporter periplasmic adaptor subunit [Planctomycetota bacterium]